MSLSVIFKDQIKILHKRIIVRSIWIPELFKEQNKETRNLWRDVIKKKNNNNGKYGNKF